MINLVSLQFKTTNCFQTNLEKLISLIKKAPKDSFIVAPEVCLTGFSYDDMDKAVEFSYKAIDILKNLSKDKKITLTMISKKDNQFFNTIYFFHKNNIVHTQSKYKLFPLDLEKKYFTPGDWEDIKIFNIDGIKIAMLICFEIRFTTLWEKLKGAQILIIPAMWGKARKEQLEIFLKALAVTNQCFVCASNSANDDMAKSSGIIGPFGDSYFDDRKNILIKQVDLKEVKKMRKYIDIGIKD
jgi:predicted amidohydrolase